tara:strand:- start:126 stop:374 length:249 start_codon:yes stop_codon:yes gene_type:complete
MGYITKTGLRSNIVTQNGSESISFIETPCTYKIEDVNFATEYFNPVTGLYDSTKSILTFESSAELLIDQAYTTTSTELIALN